MSETFDFDAFLDGSSYPTEKVSVYTNVEALARAEYINEQLTTGTLSLEEQEKLEVELDLVRVKIEQSALVFTLQGMPFRMAQDVANIFDDEKPASNEQVMKLVQETIAEVHNAAGAKTSRPNEEGLAKLQRVLSPPEFTKLVSGTMRVNFSAATYEAGIDAGFPVGSADVEQ